MIPHSAYAAKAQPPLKKESRQTCSPLKLDAVSFGQFKITQAAKKFYAQIHEMDYAIVESIGNECIYMNFVPNLSDAILRTINDTLKTMSERNALYSKNRVDFTKVSQEFIDTLTAQNRIGFNAEFQALQATLDREFKQIADLENALILEAKRMLSLSTRCHEDKTTGGIVFDKQKDQKVYQNIQEKYREICNSIIQSELNIYKSLLYF